MGKSGCSVYVLYTCFFARFLLPVPQLSKEKREKTLLPLLKAPIFFFFHVASVAFLEGGEQQTGLLMRKKAKARENKVSGGIFFGAKNVLLHGGAIGEIGT